MLFQVLLTLGLFLTVTTIVYRLVGVRKIIECVKLYGKKEYWVNYNVVFW